MYSYINISPTIDKNYKTNIFWKKNVTQLYVYGIYFYLIFYPKSIQISTIPPNIFTRVAFTCVLFSLVLFDLPISFRVTLPAMGQS